MEWRGLGWGGGGQLGRGNSSWGGGGGGREVGEILGGGGGGVGRAAAQINHQFLGVCVHCKGPI